MKKRKQFKGTSKPRKFYDRKVLKYGHTRTLSLGKIIPKDWRYVRLRVTKKTPTQINLRIEKLVGAEINEVSSSRS